MEGPEITFAEAVIDNGRFGTRTIRFETGRLAQQAQGSAAAYIDEETMLLSATSVSKQPKEHFDFFPLTIDVEERMYAAGRIPGSFFRREGRPSTEAILICRLIDRPLRPSFVEGLRNEVQVVVTVLAIEPDEYYDVLAINAASLSTQISGLPFSGPVGGVRVALIDGQWVAFPKYSQLEEAVFNMVVAGRVVTEADGNEDVAIMMVEAEATDNALEPHPGRRDQARRGRHRAGHRGVEAVHQAARRGAAVGRGDRRQADQPTTRSFLPYQPGDLRLRRRPSRYDELKGIYQIADKVERQDADDALKARVKERASPPKVEAGELPESAQRRGLRRLQVGHEERRALARPRPRASASTAAASPTSVRSTPRCRSSRACTARRSSSAARPRSWASPR